MYKLTPYDVEQLRTDTLVVWIRRPDVHHQNWWLGFYSTNTDEVRRWGRAVLQLGKELGLEPFHQGSWPIDHPLRHQGCEEKIALQDCPGVAQVFEMWLGCSEYSLHFADASLEELVELGDSALERLLQAFPKFCKHVATMY